MKRFLCGTALFFSQLTAVPYFTYGAVHAMSGYPMVGMGVRTQRAIHGLDISINVSPFQLPQSLNVYHLRGLYLLYPAKEGPYLGAGLGFLNDPETMKHMSVSLEGSIGWEGKIGQRAKIFFEIDGSVPFQRSEIWPGFTMGFGF